MTPERLAELRTRPDLIDSDEVTRLLKCVDLLHETTAILKEHTTISIETQSTITEWANDTFGRAKSNLSIAARALQEMSELITKLSADDKHVHAYDELADVEIVLARLWENLQYDRQTEINRKMRINRGRTWNLDGNGHGQHVP